MRRRRRMLSMAAVATVGTAGVVALLAAPATAQAPDIAAWWNAANVGNGAPAVAPPDVPDGDLLVQGSDPSASAPSLSPVTNAPASSQAVAGLIFDLPDGATVGALTLQVDGTAPPSVTIVACRATQKFAAEDNGQWSDVPPSDCTTATSTPKVDGGKLVFDDISKLVSNNRLAITLLPGPLDRVVIKKPDDSALAVTTPTGFGTSAPPLGSGSNAGPVAAAGPSSGGSVPAAPVGGAAVLPTTGDGGTSSGVVAPPVIAPSTATTQTGAQPAAASSAAPGSGGLSTNQRRVFAFAVIALELLGFALLMGDRTSAPVAAGAAAVGGRLRAPDRVTRRATAAPAPATVGGVGRFRSMREGPAPRL